VAGKEGAQATHGADLAVAGGVKRFTADDEVEAGIVQGRRAAVDTRRRVRVAAGH